MRQYTLDLYEYINCYLNGEQFSKEDSNLYDEVIAELDEAMYPAESDMVVYRGITCNPTLGIQRGYISTSKRLDVAQSYGEFVMEIFIKKGTLLVDVSDISYIKEEEEIIIARESLLSPTGGSKFIGVKV